MPKRKEPELDPKEQFKRFKKTVKELEIDESGKDLDSAFKSLDPVQKSFGREPQKTRESD